MNILETLLKTVNPKRLAAPAGDSRSAKSVTQWDGETLVGGLTPARLAAILRDAASGDDATAFLKLAEEMEETDLHYRSVLSTRKLAVSGIDPEVVAAGEDKDAQAQADFVKEIVEAPQFADLVTDLLDGLGKGYAVVEVVWNTTGNQWRPESYVYRSPQDFIFDRKTRTVLEKDANGQGVPLEPFRYIVHVPKLKSGLPIRGALARLAAWTFLFKNYTIKDWMRFIEVYGMPLRVGKYGANATPEDKTKLLNALRNLGTDAAAIVPSGAMIEFVQAASGTASQGPVFGQMAEYLDKQISKGVLGQTMTTDDGASKAQGEVHNDVRMDIRRADARQVVMTLMRDLIIPAVALNFGIQKKWPIVRLPVDEPEDVTAWMDNAMKAMSKGIAVSLRQIREKLLLDEPAGEGDATTGTGDQNEDGEAGSPTKPSPKGPAKGQPKGEKAKLAQHAHGCPCCGTLALAAQETDDVIDALLREQLAGDDLDALVTPVLALAEEATDFDDFIAKLSQAAGEQEAGVIVERLGPLMFMARGIGDATDKVKP